MAPDRPDASDVVTDGGVIGPVVTRVFGFCEAFSAKEGDNPTEHFVEETTVAGDEVIIEEEEVPMIKSEPSDDKSSSQSDDDLTSLSWLHQQNLLKGLEITENPSKNIKEENIINNNVICEDSLDISENTNSISSLDESYSPESNGKTSSISSNVVNYEDVVINGKSATKTVNDNTKTLNGTAQNNHTKHNHNNNNNNSSNSANFNLPVPNRNKHPTHIPYDPYLHKNSKPPYSFSCLIFMAIEDSPVKALPVKEVYAWILEHFPYFRNAPTGWKNSVRHNLSLNKCFRKVEKSPVSYTRDAIIYNLGKGSLWMVDAQYRPNLLQALSRSPFPPPTSANIASPEKAGRKVVSTRLPDPVLFPYLSKRLASSNIADSTEEFDSDVDAAAAAMLSFKHGPIILNHNKDRKKKSQESEKMVPVITRSSTEDHTYSLITSVRLERRYPNVEEAIDDVDEQRKIAEGADALLNLAGVTTMSIDKDPLAPDEEEEEDEDENSHLYGNYKNVPPYIPGSDPLEIKPVSKRRSSASSNGDVPNKRRKRPWRDAWNENGRYLKQVRG